MPSPADPVASVAPRRRRVEQREASRRRLLDATFACLIEDGYAGTTTAAITRRAGLSNGALFNHFATKDDLIVAAVLDLVPTTTAAVDDEVIEAIRSSPRPVERAVELVWLGMFAPVAVASAELFAAARTNPHLAAALAEVEPASRGEIEALTARMFPELATWPHLSALVAVVRSFALGAATARHALGDQPRFGEARALLVEALEPLVARAITEATGRPPAWAPT